MNNRRITIKRTALKWGVVVKYVNSTGSNYRILTPAELKYCFKEIKYEIEEAEENRQESV
jgi:hypothetical protein